MCSCSFSSVIDVSVVQNGLCIKSAKREKAQFALGVEDLPLIRGESLEVSLAAELVEDDVDRRVQAIQVVLVRDDDGLGHVMRIADFELVGTIALELERHPARVHVGEVVGEPSFGSRERRRDEDRNTEW